MPSYKFARHAAAVAAVAGLALSSGALNAQALVSNPASGTKTCSSPYIVTVTAQVVGAGYGQLRHTATGNLEGSDEWSTGTATYMTEMYSWDSGQHSSYVTTSRWISSLSTGCLSI